MSAISEHMRDLKAGIAASASPQAVLVAIAKQQPEARINEALEAGQRVFGENRVAEAEARWASRRQEVAGLELHLVGALQTNKAARAVALFDVIQSLDRPRLARVLAVEIAAQKRDVTCFIQVNTGDESQKSGVSPAGLPALLALARDELGLRVAGLMCIPPLEEPPALHFAFLQSLAGRHGLACLSMGMSSDWQTALKFGATHIRVGTALFGPRPG